MGSTGAHQKEEVRTGAYAPVLEGIKILELNYFYNMDCMEGMKEIPDKFFDLAIVDPPYGINVTKMNMGSRRTVKPNKKTWDSKTPDKAYFNELFRVSKNQIIWGGNYFDLPPTRCFIVWDKGESLYGRSFAEAELAWTSIDASARIFKHTPNDPTRIHPTQKPIALYEWVLTKFAKPGDKILDTHVGSGSSLIACHNLDMSYMGFEIDKDYFDKATERIERVKAQCRLW